MPDLRQSTAVEIKLGPFVDSTDGVTPETGLTISQADVRLAKNGGDWAQKNETTTLVHEENGWYRCLLDATDTNTLGILIVAVNESGALPVWREFMIKTTNAYDSDYDTDKREVDVIQIGGDTQSGTDLKDFADSGYDPATNKIEGVKTADALTANNDKTGYALSAAGVQAIWDALTAVLTTAGSIGKLLTDNVNATISSRSSHTAADVWAVGSRTLTGFGTLIADIWANATRTITGGTVTTNSDKTGYELSSSGVDAIHNDEVETGLTFREEARLSAAANSGKTNGALGPTFNIRNIADDKNRIQATVDADGNRTAVTRDLT